MKKQILFLALLCASSAHATVENNDILTEQTALHSIEQEPFIVRHANKFKNVSYVLNGYATIIAAITGGYLAADREPQGTEETIIFGNIIAAAVGIGIDTIITGPLTKYALTKKIEYQQKLLEQQKA